MNINSKVRYIVAGLLTKERKVLIALRQEDLWEFPGGKIETNENSETALIREFKEELSISITAIAEIADVEIDNEDNSVDIFSFISVDGDSSNLQLNVHKEVKFVNIEELKTINLCNADKIFVSENIETLKKYID